MLTSFTFARTPVFHFGPGKLSVLPKVIKSYGTNVLVVTGSASFTSGPSWVKLQQNLKEQGIKWSIFPVTREPSPEMIDQCVSLYREKGIQTVVAIGGGSVLDAGKAISAMLPLHDSVRLYLEGIGTKLHNGSKIPFIAVPTTSGTGSEATKNAVLSEVGEAGFKKSLRHDHFVPDVAIVDPELTLNCPPSVTAASGMDAFTQLLESFLSTTATALTDSLAVSGLQHVKESLIPAWKNGDEDLNARTGMSYAAMLSGITLANAGLGTVHGFASSLGGYFDIPHGIICSALMAPVNRITFRKLKKTGQNPEAIKKYSVTGKIFSEKKDQSEDFYAEHLLNVIDEWTTLLSIPKLSSYGVSKEHFDRILQATENKNNPVKLTNEELTEALESAL